MSLFEVIGGFAAIGWGIYAVAKLVFWVRLKIRAHSKDNFKAGDPRRYCGMQ